MQKSSDMNLNEFISQCKFRLKRILNKLEWSEESTLKDFNTNSDAALIKKVLKKRRSPYRATYPESIITGNSVVLETSKLQEILQNNEIKPASNFIELQGNFSREEKLKIYEYVIENTKNLEHKNATIEADGEISLADILAQKKREEKRKKRRFRKSKPTHIEEVRCLVDLQMQALKQFTENRLKKEGKVNWLCDVATNDNFSGKDIDKKALYVDFYKTEQNRKKFTGHHAKTDNLKRYRSGIKEYDRYKHKRHRRSSSQEFSYSKTRNNRSRSMERRKQSKSPIKETRPKRTRYSSRNDSKDKSKKVQRRSRSHSKEIVKEIKKHKRRSRSHNKEISKERSKYSSRSYEKYSKEKNYYQKNSSGRENKSSIHSKETVKSDYEYKSSHQSKSTKTYIEEINHGENYKVISQSRNKFSNHKSSKHKKRKHKRDHS